MGQTAIITPARINLTSSGQAETIQAIIHTPLEEGYTLSAFDVQLMLGEVWLADAYSLTYCEYDKAFIASFSKRTVTDNPALTADAGNRVKLTVEGLYQAVNTDGDTITRSFSYSGYIWIMAPGR
ncbi:MAG: hypothetical protein JSW34_05935 [Candidatus Zixiibacteriota bacterium]|nr:MAG: hypothetical protein JSW34_05935 [candidate division Zixibacteria bacterium]